MTKKHGFLNTNTQPIKKTNVTYKLSGSQEILVPVPETLFITHSKCKYNKMFLVINHHPE